ncbi:MAG TPA: type III pantothenate kinase [bacterium]|nr:type III pantothenate kinase [bacterium]HPR87281.1 type III pantothenate kinase [bacterium]
MLLVIDIGNTQIAAGIYQEKTLAAHWRLSSHSERTEDETWILMQSIAAAQGFDILQVSGVAISSVVPDMTVHFEKMATKYLHRHPVIVSNELDLGVKIRYQNPAQVGADRLCNAVGGIAKYGTPLIIVDLGTATTFDVISAEGAYLGGIIAPGIESSALILHQRAAKLPRVALRFPESAIGNSTESSIQSGLMFGTVEMIDGMVERIQREVGRTVRTVATGGLARVIVHQLRRVSEVDDHLTLDGLRMIYERVTIA